jgi:hypothetical protein
MDPRSADPKALRRLISPADLVLETIRNPHPSIARSRKLLGAALKLTTHLVTASPAVVLGAKGGNETAERGPEY